MKRKYSSPVMEVEVFEASEYVAACYECKPPQGGWKPPHGGSKPPQGGWWRPLQGLYIEKNNNSNLDWGDEYKGSNICYNSGEKIKSDKNIQQGYWVDGRNNVTNVSVIYDNNKYHIINPNGTNAS